MRPSTNEDETLKTRKRSKDEEDIDITDEPSLEDFDEEDGSPSDRRRDPLRH